MRYYLSTIADVGFEVRPDGTERITYGNVTAPLAKKHGLGLELAEFCISENLEEKRAEIMPHFEENAAAVPELVLHAPFNELLPHAIDPAVAALARRRYDDAWALCRKVGASKMIVHANFIETLYFPEWFIARQTAFWKDFLKDHTENVVICLENVMEKDPALLLGIVRAVDDSRLRLCLDVGHANLSPVSPETWLEACAGYLSHFHIHNNSGPVSSGYAGLGDTHSAPDNGTIPMERLLRRAEELVPEATAAVESSDLERSISWLGEKGFLK